MCGGRGGGRVCGGGEGRVWREGRAVVGLEEHHRPWVDLIPTTTGRGSCRPPGGGTELIKPPGVNTLESRQPLADYLEKTTSENDSTVRQNNLGKYSPRKWRSLQYKQRHISLG